VNPKPSAGTPKFGRNNLMRCTLDQSSDSAKNNSIKPHGFLAKFLLEDLMSRTKKSPRHPLLALRGCLAVLGLTVLCMPALG
jgi:hypothetical protein